MHLAHPHCTISIIVMDAMHKQGGKAKQPILREDVLLQKMPKSKPKHSTAPDVFAPEYGQDTWFAKQGKQGPQRYDQVTAPEQQAQAASHTWLMGLCLACRSALCVLGKVCQCLGIMS